MERTANLNLRSGRKRGTNLSNLCTRCLAVPLPVMLASTLSLAQSCHLELSLEHLVVLGKLSLCVFAGLAHLLHLDFALTREDVDLLVIHLCHPVGVPMSASPRILDPLGKGSIIAGFEDGSASYEANRSGVVHRVVRVQVSILEGRRRWHSKTTSWVLSGLWTRQSTKHAS